MSRTLGRTLSASVLPGLDGLRAVAVSLVVVYHYGLRVVPGGYGVVLFFVLSGYLITRLLLREYDDTGELRLGRFMVRRALRLFPAFWVYAAGLVGLLLLTGRPVPWAHVWSALTYTSNYHLAVWGDPGNGFSHTWSLATEEQFYALWPLALLLLLRRAANPARLVLWAIAVVWVVRWVLVLGGVPQGYVYAAFETRADALLVGCLLALWIRDPSARTVLGAFGSTRVALVAVLAIVGVAAIEFRTGAVVRNAVSFVVVPPLCGLIVLHVLHAPQRWAVRLLECRAVRYVGRISYGMYLYQQAVVWPLRMSLRDWPLVIQLVILFGVVIGLASLSFSVVERPFLRLKDRLSPIRIRSAVAA